MSSTQHQLIEQCATRLRGIVEALDNIHDTSPHRWSTDLDDVHSSAESLLAMIKDQAPPSEDQLIAAGLSYPLAKEDAVQLWYAGFRSEVVTVLEAWEAIGHDIGMNPSKGELLDSLRNMAAICNAHGNDMPAQSAIDQRQAIADAITGALAFGAQASRPPPADHWLRPFYDIGRAEGQRTQELAMLVRMLASSLKRHAPESNLVARATNYLAAKGLAGTPLRDAPASVEQVGGDERAVDGKPRATKCPDCGEGDLMPGDLCACGYETDPAAGYACSECDGSGDGYVGEVCRECDGSGWFVTPEQARAALAQPSPKCATCNGSKVVSTTDTDHNGDYIEAPCPKCGGTGEADSGGVHPWGEPVLIPCDCETEKAEAERPVVVARLYRSNDLTMTPFAEVQKPLPLPASDGTLTVDALMTVAQHERIVEARWNRAMDLMGEHVARISEKLKAERDAALARVAEMERQEPVATVAKVPGEDWNSLDFHRDLQHMQPGTKLYAAPVAQAQHSVPDGVTVNPEALRQVVRALVGPAHHIRELQVTASLPGSPITELVKQYNAWAAGAPGKEGA
ncbi:TPA: hypothetical protein NIA85_005174 [Pseudomonas aeruginosa]|nr:hypothetical protein [Pseudomonas aeruginosa]